MATVWSYIVSVDYLSSLSTLTEDTSMTTVSSCSVKLQYVLSSLERKAKILNIPCTFVAFHYYNIFLSTLGVINIIISNISIWSTYSIG